MAVLSKCRDSSHGNHEYVIESSIKPYICQANGCNNSRQITDGDRYRCSACLRVFCKTCRDADLNSLDNTIFRLDKNQKPVANDKQIAIHKSDQSLGVGKPRDEIPKNDLFLAIGKSGDEIPRKSLNPLKACGSECQDNHQYEPRDYHKEFNCDACQMPGFGKRHRCDPCGRKIHDECRSLRSNPTIDFQGQTLLFFEEPQAGIDHAPPFCLACGTEILGFNYHSPGDDHNHQGLSLHPRCAQLKKEVDINGIVFTLETKKNIPECSWCNRRQIASCHTNSPRFYYTFRGEKKKECHLHVFCMTRMVHEALKKGDWVLEKKLDSNNKLVLPEKKEVNKVGEENKKKNSIWVTVVKLFVEAVISVLIGNPVGFLFAAGEEIFNNFIDL